MKSSSTVLGVSIMAVPERQARVDNLLTRLGLSPSCVAWDPQHQGHVPTWWHAVAIASTVPVTHALILEDDADPCGDFLVAVEKIITRYPDRIISFFSASKTPLPPTTQLTLMPHHGFSDVAVVYPVAWMQALQQDFTARSQELAASKWQVSYGADELRMRLRPQLKMWCTYPSLVQHGCPTSSTLGHRFAHTVARPCLDASSSALALDWSRL